MKKARFPRTPTMRLFGLLLLVVASLLLTFGLAATRRKTSSQPESSNQPAATAAVNVASSQGTGIENAASSSSVPDINSTSLLSSNSVQPELSELMRGKESARERRESKLEAGEKEFEPEYPRGIPGSAEGDEEGENVAGREDWFMYQREYPFGKIPDEARRKAWESRPVRGKSSGDMLTTGEDVQSGTWSPIGPAPLTSFFQTRWGNTSGRVSAVAVSPADPNLVLIGGATGGIWRSTDGGASFTPVSDNQVDLSVGSIAFSKSNPSIVYAGMGEGHTSSRYFGTGVLKSTDAGQTWARVDTAGLPAPGTTNKIEVDPTDPNRLFMALYVYVDKSTNSIFIGGLYRSTNGGASWTRVIEANGRDVIIDPTNPQVIYAAMDRPVDRTTNPATVLPKNRVYKSTDGGSTWNIIYTSPQDVTGSSNIKIALSAANTQRVYVYSGNGTVSTLGISDDNGATWTNRTVEIEIDPAQFYYNNYIYADPSNANVIYVGSRDVFKSTNGGTSFTNVTGNFKTSPWSSYTPSSSSAHSDQQSFAFSTNDSNIIYIGNDGGIFKSTNGGTTFQSLNSTITLAQYVGYQLHPTNATISYGGTQDNGTQRRLPNSNAWQEFATGDGGRPVINPANPSMVFSTYVYGRIYRYVNNGTKPDPVNGQAICQQFGSNTVGCNDKFGESEDTPRIAFYPPFTSNGVDSTLYFGTWKLFTSTDNGDTWTAPGGVTDLTRGSADVLTAIGVSRSNTRVIYTGSRQGRAMVSTDGGVNWTDVTAAPLPNRSITAITVDPANPAIAYLTVSGFASGHIFKTTNTGATWTDISGNLPNIPTNALLIDPFDSTVLYAGTDIGVFRSTTGGTTWDTFNSGMPPVIVTALSAQTAASGGKIHAATYGRGAYELVTSACSYSILSNSQTVAAAGGVGSVNVTAGAGCTWTANSNASWITVNAGSTSGSGNATVGFSIAANTSNIQRTGTLTIAGQTFTVTQNGVTAPMPTVSLSSTSYIINENDPSGVATITVNRSGDTSTSFTVDFATSDASGLVPCQTNTNGIASDRCDYATAVGTLRFAVGETSKTVQIPLINDAYVEPNETFSFTLRNPQGVNLGGVFTSPVTIISDDVQTATQNPIDAQPFFIKEQYIDFLGRIAEPGGFQFWTNRMNGVAGFCAPGEVCDRIDTSMRFFQSDEFQERGFYVYRLYDATLGRLPKYAEFVPDVARLNGPQTVQEQRLGKDAYLLDFINKSEFKALYGQYLSANLLSATDAAGFVNAMCTKSGITPASKQTLISNLQAGARDPAHTLEDFILTPEMSGVGTLYYDRGFITMQYFGYLRRDPDVGGYQFWFDQLVGQAARHKGDYRFMVGGFLQSDEYRFRFALLSGGP